MAKSVLAIYNGNDYQARVFWLQACQTMNSDSKIDKVGFEVEDIRFFDDVATIYKSPILGERNEQITADYWQVKYHVDASGVFTHNQLIDPKFINSKASSILQRLHQMQVDFSHNGLGTRFYFVSPWQIQHDDPLAKLVSQNGGEIRLDVLFSDSKEMSIVREIWKKHLGLSDNYQLECVIRPLRILAGYPPLYQIRNTLNAYLISAGLLPVDEGTVSNPYDDLIRKLRVMGQSWFTWDDIEKICKREGLWRGREENQEKAIRLGIRSFARWAENMENETHRMINLVPYFDGRSIHSTELWMERIYPEMDRFFRDVLKDRVLYSLHLDCHSSIAFGAGYLVGTKSGFEVAPVQKTVSGQSVWRTKSASKSLSEMWSFTDYKIREATSDIGISIGITHSIADEVREYIHRSLPGINRIFECQLLAGVGGKAIEDGDHAYNLAQQLVQWLKKNCNNQEKQLTLHIFCAAPNGFMFFLGQQAKVLGSIKLYEHNFENPAKNCYLPSLKLPRE